MNKFVTICTTAIISALLLAGCGSNSGAPSKPDKASSEIVVGVTAGPHAEVMDFVKKEAEKQGLSVKVVEFNDFVQPNIALSQGELDINAMQHQPYLDNINKDRGLHLVSIGKNILLPMALYSNKYKDLSTLPEGAKVAIPNDPTNGGRALLLLQQAGLITLKEGVGVAASVPDIVKNPKNLTIVELEAAQIPRSIDDMDLACVNTNYAISAGLNPLKDAILVESKDSPYANVFAVQQGHEKDEKALKLISIYQSEPVKQFILDHFKGSVVPAF